MGFGQALSGLNAAAQNLDVIGNNIANASTVGYKTGTIGFADLYASSRIGLGVQVGAVQQRFTTGNIDVTGNQYDIAIDGAAGFFRLVDTSGQIVYSRNGQFIKDKDNYVVNAQGMRLTAYPADEGGVSGVGQEPVELRVPVTNIPPAATTSVTFQRNLDSRSQPVDASVTFDPNDPRTYTNSVPMTVFDSLGNTHTLMQYYVKTAANTWVVHYALDGQPMQAPDPANPPPATVDSSTLTFTQSGTLDTVDNAAAGSSKVTLTATLTNGAAPLNIVIDFAGSTQFGAPFTQNFTQNGYTSGEFASISFGTDGSIQANYTNGEMRNIGTLVLANFNNVNGLKAIGGNAWTETPESGQAILGQPGSNGLASIKGQAVETSNVDMSAELVNMIIAQRTYQANAQTIKAQDQILQTLISMR